MSRPDPRWCALIRSAPAEPDPPQRQRPAPPEPKRSEPAVPREVDRADFDPAYDPDAPIWCEMCGFRMHYTGACKILCSNCGYKRDCSDP